jgi:hypothetical protein
VVHSEFDGLAFAGRKDGDVLRAVDFDVWTPEVE